MNRQTSASANISQNTINEWSKETPNSISGASISGIPRIKIQSLTMNYFLGTYGLALPPFVDKALNVHFVLLSIRKSCSCRQTWPANQERLAKKQLKIQRMQAIGLSRWSDWVTLVCGRYRQFCTIHEINVFAKQNCCKIKCPGSYQQEIAHTVTRRPAEGKKWKKHYSNYCLKGDTFNSQAGASDILVTTLKIFHNFKFCIYSCFQFKTIFGQQSCDCSTVTLAHVGTESRPGEHNLRF